MTVHDVARALPDIATLRDRCRALAMLERILTSQGTLRYAFDSCWGPGVEVASMDNGAGDSFSIVFTPAGAFVRGFDHESAMSPAMNDDQLWPGVVDTVPEVFSAWVNEPAFSFDDLLKATVCLWRQHGDERWQTGDIEFPEGDDPDGADWLFQVVVEADPAVYRQFAEACHERTVDDDAVREVFALRPLTDELVRRLNSDVTVADLSDALVAIGYPSTPGFR